VAREYGIPAVVGVARATERITTGQQIKVDGTAGTVRIERRSRRWSRLRSIPRKNNQGKKLALVKMWYFSVSYT
jgi:phosphoenolpyruvate-protein kinase (PTS system EI component)